MGVAAGDYDNDGREDVYITALEGDRLFHNEGGGKFRDVTATAGIANASFGTSAAWFDYDRDGRLDLFVANYVQWTPKGDLWCSLDGATKSYCTPESYKGTSSKLYRNLGNGSFEDVSAKAGLADPTSKSLGVTVLDYNGDGWPDLFVANDTQPNKLYRNNRNGTFTEEGMAAGVAFGEDGVARGAMGADAADYDRSGRAHLLVGNFSNQMLGLYHNEGNGLFVDEAPASTVGRASLLSLAFGVFFFDYDLDGHPDIFAANGHIEEEIGRVQPKVQYRERPLLFRNLAGRRFDDVDHADGRGFQPAHRGSGRRLRRLRPRWRSRPARDHQQRPGLPVPQRRRQPQQLAFRPAGGPEIESRWDRRGGAREQRVRQPVEHGAQRVQLLLAKRPRSHLRAGQGCRHHGARDRMAQRREAAVRQPAGQSPPYHRRIPGCPAVTSTIS